MKRRAALKNSPQVSQSRTKRAASGIRYIETSALLAAILEGDMAAKASLRKRGRRVTSALTLAEATREVLRAGVSGRMRQPDQAAAMRVLRRFARRCDIAAITDEVLARVGRPFPVEPIRTLDAIHLATAESLVESGAPVIIITRDSRVRDNAVVLGYQVE